jgi:hypothetical protein
MSDESTQTSEAKQDYERQLGVVEALTLVTKQCPSGAVRSAAEKALADLKDQKMGGLRNQVYFVLTAMKGWRGDRATQIHRSLTDYLEESSDQ